MSAVTTSTETVSPWTMGRNVSGPVYFLLPAIGIPQSPVDFVGRGGAVKRVSFAACGKAKDVELATTRFRAAVLPQDKELETALFHRMNAKRCAVCRALFTPGSNRAKYCPECAARMKRINAAKRKRKPREKCHALGAEKPL